MASKKTINVDEVLNATGIQLQSATLGRTYKDKITGLVGIAVSRTVFLYSCVRIAIHPTALKADGSPSDAFYMDEQLLEEVPGVAIPYDEEADQIELGKTYRDSITGLEGVATALTKYLASSQRVNIQPTSLFEGKPIEAQQFDASQVTLVKAKVTPNAVEKKENIRPGGPGKMASPPRMAVR